MAKTRRIKGPFLPFVTYLVALLASAAPLSATAQAIDENIRNHEAHMHIQFKTEGGIAFIPGLNRPVNVDSKDLSKQDFEELQRLITEARFFELPGNLGAPPTGAADYQQYTVTIDEDGRQHRVQFTDLVDNPALKKLFAFLRSLQPERQ